MNSERTDRFKRNIDLEELIDEINIIFRNIRKEAFPVVKKPVYPIILINGVARSGTTLLLQWMSKSGLFAYPTNFLSRFYGSPYIGGKIQQLIFDKRYNFNNELYDFSEKIDFHSDLGKTKGPLAPNEFWYFWRRFFKFDDIQRLSKEQEKSTDIKTFLYELASIEKVFNKPIVMKGMIINWNIPFVSKISEKILFIHIKRDPIHNMRSLLEAREKYFGNKDRWYSFKPPEFERLKLLSPMEQVAGQVFFTNKAIEDGLKKIKKNRSIEIKYEEFCENPNEIYKKIERMLNDNGYLVNHNYKSEEKFENKNNIELFGNDYDLYNEIYNKFLKGFLNNV